MSDLDGRSINNNIIVVQVYVSMGVLFRTVVVVAVRRDIKKFLSLQRSDGGRRKNGKGRRDLLLEVEFQRGTLLMGREPSMCTLFCARPLCRDSRNNLVFSY